LWIVPTFPFKEPMNKEWCVPEHSIEAPSSSPSRVPSHATAYGAVCYLTENNSTRQMNFGVQSKEATQYSKQISKEATKHSKQISRRSNKDVLF